LPDAIAVVQKLLEETPDKLVQICCVLWRWWTGRNKLNAEKKNLSVNEIWRQAQYWTGECRLYCKKKTREYGEDRRLNTWMAPTEDYIKFNIDGAFKEHTRQGGWGFVARDHMGDVLGSGAGRISHAGSAVQTEAIACMEAIQAASAWGMGRIHIESDCTNLVSALKGFEYDLAREGVLFREIRSFASLNFISFEISY
jgi:hypothetical protein